eukprot:Hpha_TRINITY_DN16354_c5_g1::TRINITY_DN16354_c5_g1_i4::g.60393::m.60393
MTLWPVSVRFLVRLVGVKREEEPEHEVNKPLLCSQTLQGLKDGALAVNLDSLPGECATTFSRPVLAQTKASIIRIYTRSLSNEPGEEGRLIETEITSDYAYSVAVSSQRTLFVKVGLTPSEGAAFAIKRETLLLSKTQHDNGYSSQAHKSSNITAGIKKALKELLSTTRVRAPDGLYGIKVDGCRISCVCPFRTTTTKGRLLDISMGVTGHLAGCSKFLAKLPGPIKSKLEAISEQRRTENREKRERLRKNKEERQRRRDNTEGGTLWAAQASGQGSREHTRA